MRCLMFTAICTSLRHSAFRHVPSMLRRKVVAIFLPADLRPTVIQPTGASMQPSHVPTCQNSKILIYTPCIIQALLYMYSIAVLTFARSSIKCQSPPALVEWCHATAHLLTQQSSGVFDMLNVPLVLGVMVLKLVGAGCLGVLPSAYPLTMIGVRGKRRRRLCRLCRLCLL